MKFYFLPYFHLNLTKMKFLSAIVINVISARIILYLINLRVRLLVECTVFEVACLLIALILFTLFLVIIAETSMQVQLLILKLDLEFTKATSRLRKIGVVMADILTTNVVIEAILTYFFKYS